MSNSALPRIKLFSGVWCAIPGRGEPKKQGNLRLVAAISFCKARNYKEGRYGHYF